MVGHNRSHYTYIFRIKSAGALIFFFQNFLARGLAPVDIIKAISRNYIAEKYYSPANPEQTAMESRRRPRKLSEDENNLQPPSKRISRSSSPMTFPPSNSITEHGTSDRGSILSGATPGLHSEAATQDVPASREMDVLYDSLDSDRGTRATPQSESYAITEYESSISQALSIV